MPINVEVIVDADMETVWNAWVTPEEIKAWNAASDDWHTTASEVDLKVGGGFMSRMEARDGSVGFDFRGMYTAIINHELIEYTLEDGRKVRISFEPLSNGVRVTETFDAEQVHPVEQQRQGWQSILNNFAKYVESKK